MPNQMDGVLAHTMSDTELSHYEPNSNDGEYSQPFRHIQYKRTSSFRPIATLTMLGCRRIAGCSWPLPAEREATTKFQ
jgi:hypothetical protein